MHGDSAKMGDGHDDRRIFPGGNRPRDAARILGRDPPRRNEGRCFRSTNPARSTGVIWMSSLPIGMSTGADSPAVSRTADGRVVAPSLPKINVRTRAPSVRQRTRGGAMIRGLRNRPALAIWDALFVGDGSGSKDGLGPIVLLGMRRGSSSSSFGADGGRRGAAARPRCLRRMRTVCARHELAHGIWPMACLRHRQQTKRSQPATGGRLGDLYAASFLTRGSRRRCSARQRSYCSC